MRKSLIKKKNEIKEEESSNSNNPVRGVFNVLKNLFGIKKEENNDNNGMMTKKSTKEEIHDEKYKVEKNIENIKLFLVFLENYDLNKI